MPKKKQTVRNALLSVPPKGVHGLGVAGGRFFQQTVGRPTKPEDYHGVHTSTSMDIAAVYATGATYERFGDGHYITNEHPDAYPVILSLDVAGLEALPDVDAMAQAAFLLGDKSVRSNYQGMSLDEASEGEEQDYDFIRVGADTGSAVMEMTIYGQGPPAAFVGLPNDEDQWQTWLDTGAYTPEAAIQLVSQKRYLADFDIGRLVTIDAVKPWWPYLLESWDAGEEAEAAIAKVDAAGYRAVTDTEVMDLDVLTTQEVAKGRATESNVEYHGTSSTSAQRAFPGLKLPPNPFPVQPLQEPSMKKLKSKLLQ